MNRAQRVQGVAAAAAIAGIALTAIRVVAHEDGQPYSWRFFAGISIALAGAVVYGVGALHSATDRESIYRLGYAAGRLDTIREMNRPAQVIPLRPEPGSLTAFSRQARSAAGHPVSRARRGTARVGRADTPV